MKPERWNRVEQLLQAVLDLEEGQRATFLRQACAEDDDLRHEVESLLALRNDANGFMDTSALQVAAEAVANEQVGPSGPDKSEERDLEGKTVSHYEVLKRLARGGMGIVYKARDTKLGRFVALKFLPSELSQDQQAIERFRREAYATSALNHPNICTIYDIDEYNGEPFIAMELLSGRTLKQSIGNGPLPLDQILDWATQISRGLEAAHAQGIIHRDIKPANVFVLDDGTAKILDFGLAKLLRGGTEVAATPTSASPTGLQDSVSSPGAFLGTLMYMSPEQLCGQELDPRTDLFSFSALLYEMATATPPFSGATANEIKNAILHREPTDLEQLNPDLPAELRRIVCKGLEKEREQRYQNSSELRADLQRLKLEAESGRMRAGAPPSRLLKAFTKTKQRRVLLSAAVVVLAIIAPILLTHRPRSETLRETDSVLLTDFVNTTGEPVFDDTLKQAVAVQLAQSPFLNILSDAKIRAVLRLMAKPRDIKLTSEIARDLCQRAGARAYIAGAIASLGNQYVIGLSAVNCATGDLMAQEQETADSKEHVLKALGVAVTALRRRLGESLNTMQKFDTPLDQVTTSSLDALKAVTVGRKTLLEKGDEAAIPFFARAVELDPNFADAYAALAISYNNLREPGLARENLQKAYDLRDRVSEREKFRISNYYYLLVTGQLEKAIETNELWAQVYSRDYVPHGNLSTIYSYLGQYDSAVTEVREDLRLNPASGPAYTNLVDLYTALDRLDEAKATYLEAIAHKLENPFLHANRYGVAFLEGDAAEMERQVAWANGRTGASDVFFSFESDTDAFHGRLVAARELSQRAVESARNHDDKETAAQWQLNSALREAEFGNLERARRQAATGWALAPTRDVQVLAALAFARGGDSQRAQQLADDLAKRFPLNTVINRYWLPTVNASIEINRGNPKRAIELLESAAQYEFGNPLPQFEVGSSLYPAYVRGEANLLLHQSDQAIAEFLKFVDRSGVVVNSPLGALAHLGLAHAYAQAEDKEKSRAEFERFLALCKTADPDIAIVKKAKAEYAKLQ